MRDKLEIEAEVQIASAYEDMISKERLQVVAEAVLRYEDRSGELTLVITDDEGIQALNRSFLGVDAPTDVLSFSALDDSGPFVTAPEAGHYLGDVIISYPRAQAQAMDHGHRVETELKLLVVHGILHLLGYDHAEEEEKAIMWARQNVILANV